MGEPNINPSLWGVIVWQSFFQCLQKHKMQGYRDKKGITQMHCCELQGMLLNQIRGRPHITISLTLKTFLLMTMQCVGGCFCNQFFEMSESSAQESGNARTNLQFLHFLQAIFPSRRILGP